VTGPYYEHDGITIYHGDCREILPGIQEVGLVLTDPPYGIRVGKQKWFSHQQNQADVYGDDESFDPRFLLQIGSKRILWGANHYADKLEASSSWLVWNKIGTMKRGIISDCELAWSDIGGPARMFTHQWIGYFKASERGERYHPTQKPVALMTWCIMLSRTTGIVLDPFMGSGTTLVAAKELRREAIGIEVEERYCEVAAKRLEQEILPFPVDANEP